MIIVDKNRRPLQIFTNSKGFTLVELLIVIVIISILAAVTTVAYSGIQQKGYAAVAVASRHQYVQALQLYRSDKGRFPVVATDGATICLGVATQYPAKNGFAAGQCRYSDYTSAISSVDTSVMSEIQGYMKSTPSVEWPPAVENYSGVGNDFYRGIFYYAGTTANNGKDAYIWYFLKGDAKCGTDGYGGYDSDTGATKCTIHLM